MNKALLGGFEKIERSFDQMQTTLESIDRTLKIPSATKANEWREIAEELRQRWALEESEKFFLKSLEANPLDFMTYIGLGKTYLQLGKTEKAKDYWGKSLLHAPKDVIHYKSYSYRLLGRLDFCDGDMKQAISKLEKAIDLSPNYWLGHYDYAQYCAMTGDKKSGLTSLVVLMMAQPGLIKLAVKEQNFISLRKEIEAYIEGQKIGEGLGKTVEEANNSVLTLRHNYFDGSVFRDLNPFYKPWREKINKGTLLSKDMNHTYKALIKEKYLIPSAILNTLSAKRKGDPLKKVQSLYSKTLDLANEIIALGTDKP
jgi:tetratricopeptide (TPR) repeat protein